MKGICLSRKARKAREALNAREARNVHLWPALLAAALTLMMTGCDALQTAAPSEASAGAEETSSASASSGTSSASQRLARKRTPNTAADVTKAILFERGKNEDATGWLAIPGTDIDDPVMQSHDNLYYLHRTEREEEDIYGCYFADYECTFSTDGSLSPNTVIYGHSDLTDNPDGPRFSQLFRFTGEAFARENPVLYFSTVTRHMAWEIFAVFYTDLDDLAYNSVNLDGAALGKMIAGARERSLYDYDVTFAESGERILTLSTCTVKYGSREDQRFVVMARLLPDDTNVPQSAKLTVNPDPVQPVF